MASNQDIAALDQLPVAERFSKRVILKVAKIVNVEQHPGGSFLYILTLDCKDAEPRQIVSSIVEFYKPEDLLNKNIVIVYNLKPANFRGVRSNGMLLAASDPDTPEDQETCEVLLNQVQFLNRKDFLFLKKSFVTLSRTSFLKCL